jgi:hypothetical protein
MTRGDFGCHMALMGRAVCEHRVSGDITDGEDGRNVGAARRIHWDDATVANLDSRSGRIDEAPV